ncbi:homoserine kinase [Bacillus sp. AGMB 02131]|uniref:Homoserine kinase n=1 Tax=Peribacillus faecalis TaxID=2772559 RepID=A0A927HBJ4_9BACI|nr:homoserine kinase [Peribacillus faecalis]MBD3109044.1 homoserine kinase [Peribacillus faecalis]
MSNDDMMFSIRVPASTANLGPGFDSIGLALSLYLTVHVYRSDKWEVMPLSEEMKAFPTDESHYVIQIAKKTAAKYGKTLPTCRLAVESEIPLARGLGSSASAIVAGIQLADSLCHLHLTKEEKVYLASYEEGHPDNAGASVAGGLVVGMHEEEQTSLLSFPLASVAVAVVIPKYELLTSDSRNVLPPSLSFKESVKASAIANTFLAALLSGNFELAGSMMKRDLFHQPYRRELVPLLSEVEGFAYERGAFGVALSGAGPSIVCFAETEKMSHLLEDLSERFPDCDVKQVEIDQEGCVVMTKADTIHS